jgi:hypothetical protein
MSRMLLAAVLLALPAAAQPSPVLVELFTSEGCSSCPPADILLGELSSGRLDAGAPVVALALHVDYWNRLGWTDPFSSRAFTERQGSYAKDGNVYTPQMVVDGSTALVGSDRRRALEAIRAAAGERKTPLELNVTSSPKDVAVKISGPALPKGAATADLLVAITEDGLVSDVARGENAGKKLPHAAVVRSLTRVERVKCGEALAASRTFKLDPAWKRDALHVVAFLQEGSGKVVGVARGAVFSEGALARNVPR